MRWQLMACLLLAGWLAGCGVFRNGTRDKRMERLETAVVMDVGRIDTGMRLVLERWRVDQPVTGAWFEPNGVTSTGAVRAASPLADLHAGLDSLGKVLGGALVFPPSVLTVSGERLTLEKRGESEWDRSALEVEVENKADVRTGTASWKGVWVWIGGIALVLAFLFLLIRYYLRR